MTERPLAQDAQEGTLSPPEGSYVPDVNCLSCGKTIVLESVTYFDYEGPVICEACKGRTTVVIRGGKLESALGGTNWFALVADLEPYDIPLPVLEDIMEAVAVFSINAYRASAVMSGRAMHGALLTKQIPDQMLGEMLVTAHDQKLISTDLFKMTEAANYFRVTGAHFKELREVDQTKALLTMQVTKDVLKHLFPKSLTPAWKSRIGSSVP